MATLRLGAVQRRLAAALLDHHVPGPVPLPRHRGFLGWLQAALRDPAAWRARCYWLVRLPLALASVYTFILWGTSVYWLTYPLWFGGHAADGLPPVVLDRSTWPGAVVVALAGAATALVIVPAGLVWLTWVDGRLVRWLLGPGGSEERVHELQRARTRLIDDAAAQLRRIERDLHDGTQAQLGTLAMNLGQAKEKLEGCDGVPYDPAGALTLVDAAHRHAKEALVELRDIVQGIHPPALDVGLEAALATLVARVRFPATLAVDLPERPSPAIETIAYYSAAELLANVARHSGARRAVVELTERDGRLRLHVGDDGIGGAAASTAEGAGTGLTGLAERLRAVDGRLDIVSPPGGPTAVTVVLPLRA